MYDKLSVLTLAKERMDWVARRQEVVAENIANANTPHYIPKDVIPFDQMLAQTVPSVPVTATNPRHFSPQLEDPLLVVSTRKTYEASPNGNGVVLEEQLNKIRQAKTAYDASASLYQKQFKLFRTALKGSGT